MRLESYAQQFEDLFLYSILHDVDEGFYIDVGANDPTIDSVTKFFYDRGWSGINIDPMENCCKLLRSARPRDLTLCIGIGAERSEKFLYELPYLDGRSTFSDEVAQNKFKDYLHRDVSSEEFKHKTPTEIVTMEDVVQTYLPPPPRNQVHFCKIDVEGFEKDVLLGVKNWQRFRPWVFCIEATLPKPDSYLEWEKILFENHYEFMFNYHVNRFYIDSRLKHLRKTLDGVGEFLRQFEIRRMGMSPPIGFK